MSVLGYTQLLKTASTAPTLVTFDPLNTGTGTTLSNGDLTAAKGLGANGISRCTVGKSSGKWYAEFLVDVGNPTSAFVVIGIVNNSMNLNSEMGSNTNSWGYYSNAAKQYNGVFAGYGATYTAGNVIGLALDMDAGTITMYKNNVSQGTMYTGITGTIYMAVHGIAGAPAQVTARFAQSSWSYTAPSGYGELTP